MGRKMGRLQFISTLWKTMENSKMLQKLKTILQKIKKRLFGKLCECEPEPKKRGRGRPKKS